MNQPLITKELLDEYGIELSDQDEQSLIDHLNTTLTERVGSEVALSLDDDKLKELAKLQTSASDEEIGNWLEKNVPELQQITQDEIDILLGELAENSEPISDAS